MAEQIKGAWRVVGCYRAGSRHMVGFARAVSDGVSFAYLADVYIEPDHRGRGLGKRLVEAMIGGGPGATFRWLLHTADAHGLYQRFGFRPADATLLDRRMLRPDRLRLPPDGGLDGVRFWRVFG